MSLPGLPEICEDRAELSPLNMMNFYILIKMKKKFYIKPYTVVAMIDGKETIMEFDINDKSFEAGGAPAKDRDELEEEEEAAAAADFGQVQKYSLW